MDYGRAIGDAFRMTFTSRAQWIWALIWAAINLALAFVITVLIFALVVGASGVSARAFFDPAAGPGSATAVENAGATFCGALLFGVLLIAAAVVLSTYFSAWLSAGLVSIAARTAGGHPPRLSESWAMARADAKRVWGIQWLSLYLPSLAVGFLLYVALVLIMFATFAQGSPSSSPELGASSIAVFGAFGLVAAFLYGLLLAWSELSVRQAVLGRMRATESLRAGFRSLTSRFGGVLLMLFVIGAVMVSWYAISFVVSYVQGQIEDVRVYWVAYVSWLVVSWFVGVLIGILTSNVWTMYSFQLIAASPPQIAERGYEPTTPSSPPPPPGVVGSEYVPQSPPPPPFVSQPVPPEPAAPQYAPQPPAPPQHEQGIPLAQPPSESPDADGGEDASQSDASTDPEQGSSEFFDA